MIKIKGKIISFDFDGTLDTEFDNSLNPQKDEIQRVCKELMLANDVCIITRRYGPNHAEVEKVYNLANILGIDKNKIHFTNRQYKFSFILKMNIDIHFENDEYECQLISQACPNVLVVPVEDPYWRDLIY